MNEIVTGFVCLHAYPVRTQHTLRPHAPACSNPAATFSPELADLSTHVIVTAAGQYNCRENGPGVTRLAVSAGEVHQEELPVPAEDVA